MEEVAKIAAALSQYSLGVGFDPARLVAMHQMLPLWAAGLVAVSGLLACLFGSGQVAFRLVLAVPIGGAGWALGPALGRPMHLDPVTAAYGAAFTLAACALAYPPAILFTLGGVLGSLLGMELVEQGDRLLGAIPGFIVAGVLTLLARRFLSIALSAVVGAASLSLGAVTLLAHTKLAGLVLDFPSVTVAVAGCVAVGSIAYQLRFNPTAEELARSKAEKARKRQLERDEQQRRKRLERYGRAEDKQS